MRAGRIPPDPSVQEMIEWIASRYHMNKSSLSRMFQTTPSTIHSWLKSGKISFKNLKKIRVGFYYLHNTTDPHASERKCSECGKWLSISFFREGKAICRSCENGKTLKYYWQNREEQLKKRRSKNWYNRSKKHA